MVQSVEELEERLSRPRAALIEDLRKLDGDVVVLGAAGKMGPSLVRLAARAISEAGTGADVIAVSRFSQPGSADALRAAGARVVPADITDDDALAGLPDAENVVFLVGAKFGATGNEPATWATNTYLPGRVAERYAGSRIVALSTGNVYPLTQTGSGGPTEDHPVGPVGDYAMSCLGRERIFTHFATTRQTPTALIRLNYAVEPRYGVLVDIARQVHAGRPVDLTTGYANVVWQGYANEVILRSLLHADVPPFLLNLTGPETISVRSVAEQFARAFGTDVQYTGTEAATALLSNAGRCHGLFGYPDVPLAELVEMVADWLRNDLPLLDKPTKFDVRDGQF
ncbi:NAD-dependent epimerase/dehydratase family protein [Phytoactinopolyspora halotolerans]|uniref:NAD(P)-dependent oxidoreductase n=1 Tax=Phytoactinopolyspora halotolerans TaxID=1981512 RepID=A0A6L9S1X0_9ACTN|nr:NAD(P)-dependent oxidoreductase [Phytoactinopolyspora halotolerans]NED98988.1 NAD(P)-dependent oxidoreductase [Phytoactinopolyspora halotolerans]